VCLPYTCGSLQSMQLFVCSCPAGDNHYGLVSVLMCCWHADCIRCPRSLGHRNLHGDEGADLTSSSDYMHDFARILTS